MPVRLGTAILASAGASSLLVAWLWIDPLDHGTAVANGAGLAAAMTAAILLAWRASRTSHALVWIALACAATSFAAAEAYRFFVGDIGAPHARSLAWADAAYVVGYAFLATALVISFPSPRTVRNITRHALDFLALGTSIMALAWIVSLRDLAQGGGAVEGAVAAAYAALDLALLSLLVIVAGELRPTHRPRVVLFGSALVAWALADFVHAVEVIRGTTGPAPSASALRFGGYALFGSAAWVDEPKELRWPRWNLRGAVYVPIIILLPVAAVDFLETRRMEPILFALGIVMVGALAGRQILYARALIETNQELARREEELEVAQEIARMGSWVWDARTRRVEWSPQMHALFQRPPDEGLPAEGLDAGMFAPESSARLAEALRRARHTGATFELELRSDGLEAEWMHVRAQPVCDADGAVTAIRGTCQDVTERRRAQSAQEALQQRYRNILENSPDGILRTTIEGRLEYANPAAAELLGYGSAAQLLRKCPNVTELYVPPTDRQRLLKQVARRRPKPLRVQFRCRDGSTIWVEIHARMHKEDGGQYIEGIFRDLSAERAQQELASTIAAIVESTQEAIYSIDLEGVIQTWNPAAESLYGYTAKEAVGTAYETLVVPTDRRRAFGEELAGLRVGRSIARHDDVRRHKDGSLVDVSVSMVPMRDASGNIIAISATSHDISDRLRAEEAEWARLENENLKQLEQTLRDFINAAAHDLNQPLTPMRLALVTLQESLRDVPAPARRSLATMKRSVDRMALLVADLLDVARLESGTLQFEFKTVDLAGPLQEVGDFFEAAADEAGLSWHVEVPEDLAVVADSRRLMQVLNNFVGNAFKYTPAGGRVTVRAQRRGGVARVEISDTGRGLTPAQLSKLFRPFSQVHTHLPDAPTGTGLGLYIAKGIVEQHGGSTGVDSRGPGQGATFWFEIPLAAKAPSSAATHALPQAATREGAGGVARAPSMAAPGVEREEDTAWRKR